MTSSMSSRPDLKQIKRQAKELLKAQKAADPTVCPMLRLIPRLAHMANQEILSTAVGLQEAQHALAIEYGFRTWAELKLHVKAAASEPTSVRDASRARLIESVTVRTMTQQDIATLRRFDEDLAATLEEVNAQYPPSGHSTVPGGPWADDAELAGHFAKYQRHGGTILLAEDRGRVVGFADLWPADEPDPFGRSLNVECIDYFREYYLAGLETRLLTEAETIARALGLPALDIGTNTCSGEYVSLRRFGLQVFYEYDRLVCRCQPASGARPRKAELTAETAELGGLIRANHWSPTDFTFRADEEPTYLAELRWSDHRAIIELWHYTPGQDNAPVPPNPPNRSELFVPPAALESATMMSEILAECAAVAGELGADQIELACPSSLDLDARKIEVLDRHFAFAWLRKRL